VFSQKVDIIAPDGKRSELPGETKFEFKAAPFHRVFHYFGPFTARMSGIYRFMVRIKGDEEEEWRDETEVPFLLVDPQEAQKMIEAEIEKAKGTINANEPLSA